MSSQHRAALLACFARCSFASCDDVARALGMRPATFASIVRTPGSGVRKLIEAESCRFDLVNERVERC